MESSGKFVFDEAMLNNLDLKEYDDMFKNPNFDYRAPSEGLVLRPLAKDDINKGFLEVLAQLTSTGDVKDENYTGRFEDMQRAGTYFPVVVEDVNGNSGKGLIVATGMMLTEQKFIHSCALRGRIEELIVDKNYRDKNLRKVVLAVVTELSKVVGCYKTTLESNDEDIPLYVQFKYVVDQEKFLQCRFRS